MFSFRTPKQCFYKSRLRWLSCCWLALTLTGNTALASSEEPASLAVLPWQLVATYPHQPAAFTQGLELYHGHLIESSGLYGNSKLFSRPFPSSTATSNSTAANKNTTAAAPSLKGTALPSTLFAEGLTVYRGKIYLLSWRSGMGLIIDPEHFGLLGRFHYRGQGWGLCYSQTGPGHFIMSDGSASLQLRDTDSFHLIQQLPVQFKTQRFDKLNELECHGDYVLANQWRETRILVIHANSGQVVAELDLGELVAREQASWTASTPPPSHRHEAVLNGIAYDVRDNSWLVTGKLWRHIYRISFPFPPPLSPLSSGDSIR